MPRTLIYKEIQSINKPIENVWALLSSFGAIKAWMPMIEACTVDGNGIGAVRTAQMLGQAFQEKLEVCDSQAHTLSYRFLDPTGFPMTGGHSTWRLESKADDKTQITWTADAEEADDAGVAIIRSVFEPFMASCIEGLREALEKPALK